VREQVREELRGLQRRLRITTLYVTHDQLEALGLSDVVAVMDRGRIVEIGTPQALYARPRHPFTAAFLGEISYLAGTVRDAADGAVTIETPLGPLRAAAPERPAPGAAVVAGVRPEHVRLSRVPPADGNVLAGTVVSALFEGTRVKYRVAVGDSQLLAYGSEHLGLDERVYAGIDPAHLILLPRLPGE
jgi:ABC-type Fe3+/spermidine/putrescine transport system ATPase subunit